LICFNVEVTNVIREGAPKQRKKCEAFIYLGEMTKTSGEVNNKKCILV
jgi:hypothetical protein